MEIIKKSLKRVINIFGESKKRKVSYGVSATELRNYFLNDPILDWLNLYGEEKGYQKDKEENSYSLYWMNRGNEYEDILIDDLKNKNFTFKNVKEDYPKFCHDGFEDTLDYMREGIEIIYQGFLLDEEKEIYGIPDLLIRCDTFHKLFNFDVPIIYPTNKDFSWTYFVVDIKCSTIKLNNDNKISNQLGKKVFKSQIYIYNSILEKLFFNNSSSQPFGFLLARRVVKNNVVQDNNICAINFDEENIRDEVEQALSWIKKVREKGMNWDIDNPTRNELKPNMKNKRDYPWSNAKQIIANKQKELTRIWHVSSKIRDNCKENDFPNHFTCDKKKLIISKMFKSDSDEEIENDYDTVDLSSILKKDTLNFYVDFEYINGSDLSFDKYPRTHLYLIGVGYFDNNWKYKSFFPNQINDRDEKTVLHKWIQFMNETTKKLNYNKYQIIHWSKAEPSLYKRLKELFLLRTKLDWIDLQPILKKSCIVFDNMKNYSLKNVAKTMKNMGFIETNWEDNVVDGLGANMIIIKGIKNQIGDINGFDDIIKYNEVDCKVMYEIIKFLSSFTKKNL